MTEFNEKLQRIAELGTELAEIINTNSGLISADVEWPDRGPKVLKMHVSSGKYKEIKKAFNPVWKLRTHYEGYHFEAEFKGIKLLMIFSDRELPEELAEQVETDIERRIRERKKAQSAGTDEAE